MSRKRKGRDVNGILVLDKPGGMSSNQALQRCKYFFGARKAGHTGALDPLATGVLPLCFGEATKFSQFLLDADKRYQSEFIFGQATTTCDADGELIAEESAAGISREAVEAAIQGFIGPIEQVPPMYSALKRDGQPLYKLARQGVEVERAPRPVTVHRFDLLDFSPGPIARATVDIRCSKGTYIRSLAVDLAAALGNYAHVAQLRRTEAGAFTLAQAVNLNQLKAIAESEPVAGDRHGAFAETDTGTDTGTGIDNSDNSDRHTALDRHLLPVDAGISYLPAVELNEKQAEMLAQGKPLIGGNKLSENASNRVRSGTVRVMLRARFMGVAELNASGELRSKRLLATN